MEAGGVPFVLNYYVKQHKDATFVEPLTRERQHGICSIWSSGQRQSPRTHVPVELAEPSAQIHLYLCGPEGFMKQMTEMAIRFGWLAENIHTEAFKPAELTERVEDNNSFTVTLASTAQQWQVPAKKSIARVLTENSVDVPLSCEMGMCGACLTGVKEGKVDHRDTVQSDCEKMQNSNKSRFAVPAVCQQIGD
ncbi:ferredoxin [Erwinia tracheiphila PSU-1]|nr:2Fe-2S iron-sulfur cluster-binding protein [Erwinia tracheiphila]EOS95256.1 ferredoxin [Erwinia tracheiphila PSU-1]UIA94294.1 2Fe-2S iron-sulfur cluster-binding protein [Erwinia tracheiphila]